MESKTSKTKTSILFFLNERKKTGNLTVTRKEILNFFNDPDLTTIIDSSLQSLKNVDQTIKSTGRGGYSLVPKKKGDLVVEKITNTLTELFVKEEDGEKRIREEFLKVSIKEVANSCSYGSKLLIGLTLMKFIEKDPNSTSYRWIYETLPSEELTRELIVPFLRKNKDMTQLRSKLMREVIMQEMVEASYQEGRIHPIPVKNSKIRNLVSTEFGISRSTVSDMFIKLVEEGLLLPAKSKEGYERGWYQLVIKEEETLIKEVTINVTNPASSIKVDRVFKEKLVLKKQTSEDKPIQIKRGFYFNIVSKPIDSPDTEYKTIDYTQHIKQFSEDPPSYFEAYSSPIKEFGYLSEKSSLSDLLLLMEDHPTTKFAIEKISYEYLIEVTSKKYVTDF